MSTILPCSWGLLTNLDIADWQWLQNKTLGNMHTASRPNQNKTEDTELHCVACSLMGCMNTSVIQPQPLVCCGGLVAMCLSCAMLTMIIVSDSLGGLQRLINGMHHFCSVSSLVIGIAKTEVVIFMDLVFRAAGPCRDAFRGVCNR